MIFSRASLSVVSAASDDPRRRALNSVHIAEDGTTVASDGTVLIAVSPVDAESSHFPLDLHVEPPSGGVCVELDIVEQAIKNLPKDSRPHTQYAAMTRCDDAEVEFATTNLRKTQKVASAPLRDRFPDWRGSIAGARGMARVGRVCLDRRRLISLLRTLEAAAGEEEAVFIEIGDENDAILIRTQNPETKQRIVARMQPLDTRGGWLKRNKWEKGIEEG